MAKQTLRLKYLTGIFLLLIFSVSLLDAWGLHTLEKYGVFARFHAVDTRTFDELGRSQPLTSYSDAIWFRQELAGAGLNHGSDEQQVVQVMKWIMNQVNKADVSSPGSAREALQLARNGEGLSCGAMSQIFGEALNSLGFQTRQIQLVRSLLNNKDTHVTTEVLIGGKWVIFDPTFNVSYKKNGTLIGVQEIRKALLDGTASDIKPCFYGEVAYPARLEAYYLNWLPLYNNLFIYEQRNTELWSKIPPFRYLFGPRIYYLEENSKGLWYFELEEKVYFVFVVLLPVITCILFLVLILTLFICSRKKGVNYYRI